MTTDPTQPRLLVLEQAQAELAIAQDVLRSARYEVAKLTAWVAFLKQDDWDESDAS